MIPPAEIMRVAVRFWVRDDDMREIPQMQEEPGLVIFTPMGGHRLWIYCAELPWDPIDGPQFGHPPVGWCASNVFPQGELGVIHTNSPIFTEITREQFLTAADQGFPDWEGGTNVPDDEKEGPEGAP